MTKFILGTCIVVGLVLSFHDTLWPWAIIPAGIVWGMLGLALLFEGRTIES